MNILAILGSPRRDGNTAMLLRKFLDGLKESDRHLAREIYLQDLKIAPCRNCDSCRTLEDRYCVLDDDMQPLYRRFIEADMLVLASPIYWWSISAQLKLFIDRLYGLNPDQNLDFFKGKKLVIILSYYDQDPNLGAEMVLQMFREIADYTEMLLIGLLRFSSGRQHVCDCPEKLKEAVDLGRRLGSERRRSRK